MTDYLFSWYSRLGTNSIICSVKDWTHGTHTIHNNNNNNSVKKYWVLNAKCNGLRQKRLFIVQESLLWLNNECCLLGKQT